MLSHPLVLYVLFLFTDSKFHLLLMFMFACINPNMYMYIFAKIYPRVSRALLRMRED